MMQDFFPSPRASFLRAGVVLAVVLAATACASKPDWTKKGAADAEIERDWSQCRVMADQQTGVRDDDSAKSTSPLANYDRQKTASRNRAIIDACMRGRGYFPTKR